MPRVLFLSYDGLTDPLGQSQVLPYLMGLAAKGHRIAIVSCDKQEALAARGQAVAAQCALAGIDWQPVRYRPSPPVASTLANLVAMEREAAAMQRAAPFDIVHCRSLLPALIGRRMQRRDGTRFLFDMRGFWIDERFERGIWSEANPLYRVIATWLRQRERDAYANADAVVSLTNAAKDELGRRGGADWAAKTAVIPCCADLDHFHPRGGAARVEGRTMLDLSSDTPVLLFLGSLGGAYPLDPVFRFFRHWSEGRDDARLLFVTRHPAAEIVAHPAAAGLEAQIIVRAGERADMPALVAAADAGLSFILPSFCAIASSPTKVGEMLAMGVPVAANAGVGDMTPIMREPGAGVLLPDFEPASVEQAADAMRCLPCDPIAARAVAQGWFALDSGVSTYDRLYRDLVSR